VNRRRYRAGLLALLFFTGTATAQVSTGGPHFERIGTESGPPPEVITSLLQDRTGFIWIGARDGLTLYDGHTFTVFEHDPADPHSISDNTIRTIYEDSRGNIWFGTNTGGSYCGFSGTSSATPHVSGTLALMLQANQGATPAELAEALLTTAEHRGDPGKNNVYGVGLVQAYGAVSAIESGVIYLSHTIDDSEAGNGDTMIDPGETVLMQIDVESRSEVAIDGLEGILSTRTPGITIHNRHATYPSLPARGATATSNAPHYSLSIDPSECSTIAVFDLELRYGGERSRSTFTVRVGEPETVILLDDDFEADLGWTVDDGTCTQGFWVREDPIGVQDGQSRYSNPEDDTSDPGTTCWVTGNGELTGKKDENNNDVDGGMVTLTSPPFGLDHMLSLNLSYDRWYYDVDSGNSFRAEISNDGGMDWLLLEEWIYSAGGWYDSNIDLFALLPSTDDMLLRFIVHDDGADDPVEGAIDEVLIEGIWVNCQPYDPPVALPPNPVGYTLMVEKSTYGHAELTWDAPLVDGGHDAATLYRMHRGLAPNAPFDEPGSATTTGRWKTASFDPAVMTTWRSGSIDLPNRRCT